MNSQKFTLTTADAMNLGAQQASDSSHDFGARLKILMADMENDHRAVAGNTLPAFRQGQNQLNDAFAGLTRWCSMHGVQLSEGHNDAVNTDQDMQGTFQAAKTDLQINV